MGGLVDNLNRSITSLFQTCGQFQGLLQCEAIGLCEVIIDRRGAEIWPQLGNCIHSR